MFVNILKNDEGAVNIEWAVGFAAILTLGAAVVMSIDTGTQATSAQINSAFTPLSMDLMNMTPPVTIGSLVGSSSYNVTQGGQAVSQVNCQHYMMSNGETWKNCTETANSGDAQAQYWLDANGQVTEPPNVNQSGT